MAQTKLIRNLPGFLSERIRLDLSVWEDGIPVELIEESRRFRNQLSETGIAWGKINLWIEIKDRSIRFKKIRWHEYNEVVLDYFQYLAGKYEVPDVTMVVNCWDWPVVLKHLPLPIFSFVKTNLHNDILLPNPQILRGIIKNQPFDPKDTSWRMKKEVALFRGAASGPRYLPVSWKSTPRMRLLQIGKSFPDLLDVGITYDHGRPISDMKELIPMNEWPDYKYIVHVDGNTTAWRLAWSLYLHSVVLKQDSPFIEYWYDGLEPFKHYVPVRENLGNLVERILELKKNDDMALEIATNSADFARDHLSFDAIDNYVLSLLREYSRLLDAYE